MIVQQKQITSVVDACAAVGAHNLFTRLASGLIQCRGYDAERDRVEGSSLGQQGQLLGLDVGRYDDHIQSPESLRFAIYAIVVVTAMVEEVL